MERRPFGRFAALLAFAALPHLRTDLLAQELLPGERAALAARSEGAEDRVAKNLLFAAQQLAAAGGGDAVAAARVEALASEAARCAPATVLPEVLSLLDELRGSPLAKANALLADRLGIAALSAAATHPAGRAGERAAALGFVRSWWLAGPFANERGNGFGTALPPEERLDLDAELTGKHGALHWRALPALPSRPELPLERLVHPHEQTLVYAATAAIAGSATDAVLEFGSTGAVRVLVNGAEVFAREVERGFAFDQDAVTVHLRAGANLLLFKVCHQEGDEFRFAARLRAVDGAPIAAVRTSGERADLDAAIAAVAAHKAEVEQAGAAPLLGGRSTWAIGSAHEADALRLAWLWRARAADGDRDRRDRAAAEAAAKDLPDLPEAQLVLAASRERHGRAAADQDDNDRRRALERALTLDAQHVAALVADGRLLLDRSKLVRPALALADRALARCAGHGDATLLRADALHALDLDELANGEVVAAAAAPTASPGLLVRAAEALVGRQPRPALALQERALGLSGAESTLTAVASLRARIGDRAGAVALLEQTVVADPFAVDARRSLVRLLLARDEARAAVTLLDGWLQIAPDDADVLSESASCWRRLRGADDQSGANQIAQLREALVVEPTRRDDERYVEFLATGTSGEPGAWYTPFAVDAAALVKADPGAPADAIAAKDPTRWLLRQRIVRAFANGTTSLYQHDIVRILSEDGARSLASYRVSYYRGEQRGRLLACMLFRADGTVERPALRGDSVRLPDLRIGDVLSVEGRTDDLAPTFFGDYFGYTDEFTADDGSPVQQSEIVVLADPGRDYRWQNVNGAPEPERATLADGTLQFRWRMQDLPRDVPEVRRPDRAERDPLVRMTTYRDWPQFAAWWWNLIKNQLEVTPAMRKKVEELCAGKADLAAKIAAIYHFVTTDVRYEAWEFGVHGYKPYSTPIIFERRHGDCKDKALLLCALLGEIGVVAHPVLIHAESLRSADDLELAMVQHFNHCIAWLPAQQGMPGRFLDGTAVWHPTDTLPDMDQGARVLVVDRGKAELRDVDWTTPDRNRDQTALEVRLADDGQAELRYTIQPFANQAVGLREMLATEPARRSEVVERWLTRQFGKLTVTGVEASTPDDPELPVQLSVLAKMPELGRRADGTWALPSTWDTENLQAMASDSERRTPVLLGVPRGGREVVRFKVPPGWRAADLPQNVSQQAPFGRFAMQWRRDGSDVVVERELAFTAPRVAVADYAALRSFVTAVKAADSQLVLLQKEGGR